MKGQVHNVTAALCAFPWTGKSGQDQARASKGKLQRLGTIEKGVYVHYLYNDAKGSSVFDRNRGGKLLILPRRATIKFGKFQGGLVARRSQDAHHLHRRPKRSRATHWPITPKTFPVCLQSALVLDMTGRSVFEVQRAERVLRKKLKLFLIEQEVEVQDHRGDYRLLMGPAPSGFAKRLNKWARQMFREISG